MNRLYLLAPANWLSEQDRERLEALNHEKDFSILNVAGQSELLRLTHPHLSDAIYRALRDPGNPRAFANDLAQAAERSLAGSITTLRLLLRTFSSGDPRIVERLADVDLNHLAELVVRHWKNSDIARRCQSFELADLWCSWACWHARRPELRLEQLHGCSLLEAARRALSEAGVTWAFLWQRLRAAFPQSVSLLNDAVEWLHEPASQDSGGWSFVWEEVWRARDTDGALFDEPTLAKCAQSWLQQQWDREDWHFVWKHLVNPPDLTGAKPYTAELVQLGWQWVFDIPPQGQSPLASNTEKAAWAYVWQDLLEQQRFESGAARDILLLQGREWLNGRQHFGEWSYVWRNLFGQQRLPESVSRDALRETGVAWLCGREDRNDWTRVWEALLEQQQWLDSVTIGALLQQGVDWLVGREDRATWAFVWRKLVDQQQPLDTVTQNAVLQRGVGSVDEPAELK